MRKSQISRGFQCQVFSSIRFDGFGIRVPHPKPILLSSLRIGGLNLAHMQSVYV